MRTPAESDAGPAPARSGLPGWLKKTIGVGVGAGALVGTYFLAAAFLPRWWAQRAGQLSSGSMQQGILWGLMLGALCTFVPLLLLGFAWRLRKRRRARWLLAVLPLLAVAAALPNLLTLAVAVGSNNSAHAGQRIMDVDAPGFRGATLAGAVTGALGYLTVAVLSFLYRRRGRQMKELRAQQGEAGA